MKPLKDLNLTNRFLFDEVMSDPDTHREALSIIFGREIPILEYNETEREGRKTPSIRSIRMDVYAIDEEQVIYNTEMQDERKKDLAKRTRYYQALVDTGLLEPGIPNYNILNESYIIMITTFDLFGQDKYVYTFRPECKEVPGLILNDGAVRIFLNTKGKNDEEVGVKYMQAWEEKYYAKEEGREEVLKEQIQKKIAKGKTIDQMADELEQEKSLIEELIQQMEEEE